MPAFVFSRRCLMLLAIVFLIPGFLTPAVAYQQSATSSEKDEQPKVNPKATDSKGDSADSTPPLMMLEVTINKPANPGRGYRRPYVAAWLTDKDDFPVRTILLWVQKDGKGPRWIPDLRQWHRDDRMRGIVSDLDLVDAVSGPTRNSGTYKVPWDGNDDLNEPLPPGTYTLNVEAAREHGTYQIIREKLELGDKAFKKDLKGNEEIKSVRVIYSGMSAAQK